VASRNRDLRRTARFVVGRMRRVSGSLNRRSLRSDSVFVAGPQERRGKVCGVWSAAESGASGTQRSGEGRSLCVEAQGGDRLPYHRKPIDNGPFRDIVAFAARRCAANEQYGSFDSDSGFRFNNFDYWLSPVCFAGTEANGATRNSCRLRFCRDFGNFRVDRRIGGYWSGDCLFNQLLDGRRETRSSGGVQ